MRGLLTKTIENEQQMMMTKVTEGCGLRVRDVTLLISAGHGMDVGVADWMV